MMRNVHTSYMFNKYSWKMNIKWNINSKVYHWMKYHFINHWWIKLYPLFIFNEKTLTSLWFIGIWNTLYFQLSWGLKLFWNNAHINPGSSDGKGSTCNSGDPVSIPGLGRSPGEGNGYPLHYSGLENFMDSIFHGVAKSRTQLSDFHFHIYIYI